MSALGLEIFDGDGDTVTRAPYGTLAGSATGCDPNHDQRVEASDLSCTVLKIFNGPSACEVADPDVSAPLLDPTLDSSTLVATRFLYDGPNAVQHGMDPVLITRERAAVLRGRVLDRAGDPIPFVRVDMQGHPEYGFTLTQADGEYDMVVNGGGQLALNFERFELLPAQRTAIVPWGDCVVLPDLVMIPVDDRVTLVDLSQSGSVQVARGNPVSDADGTRQATMLFKAGTTAVLTRTDGTTLALSNLHVRATEYTVGDSGPNAMPGSLPPESGYTYAVELSVDEAMAEGAMDVGFNQPVSFYVENFLDFPIGMAVPAGFYKQAKVAWIPSKNGVVIKILSVVGGVANLDTNGDEIADSAAILAALGITQAERVSLAQLYVAGQELW